MIDTIAFARAFQKLAARRRLHLAACAIIAMVSASCAHIDNVATNAMPPAVATPDAALAELRAGNERFVASSMLERDLKSQVSSASGGQKPFAIVLGCIDSRVPPEIIFDQGIGDIFSARTAGNFENTDILGSMEFATAVVGAKLIVVLGHTDCGAVKGAIDGVELGNVTAMLENISSAVTTVPESLGERSSKNKAFLEAVSEQNVRKTMQDIEAYSPVIAGLVAEGKVKIVGGSYELTSGKVTFYD